MSSSRDELQRERDRLLQALSDVHTKINELAPVSKLATETFQEIFKICAMTQDGYTGAKRGTSLAWTRVCRAWRLISLNAARRWISIEILRQAYESNWCYVKECLKHSTLARRYLMPSSEDLRLSTNRLKTIKVTEFRKEILVLFKLLGTDFPCLDYLMLETDFPSQELNITLPARLKQLALTNISIPWDTCLGLEELTHLSLCLPGQTSPLSLSKLFMILDGSPRLEHVVLRLALPPGTISRDPIALSNLRHLTVGHTEPLVLSLLQNVILPPQMPLDIDCSKFNDIHDLLPYGSVIASRTTSAKIVSFSNQAVYFWDSVTTFWTLEGCKLSLHLPSPNHPSLMRHLSCIVDLSNVTVLDMEIFVYGLRGILPFLIHIPNLDTLRISYEPHMGDFITVLTDLNLPSRYDLIGARSELLCPRLRHIYFGRPNCCVRSREYHRAPLVRLAKARHDANIRLETIHFDYCRCQLEGPIPRDLYDELQKYVTKVRVNLATGR